MKNIYRVISLSCVKFLPFIKYIYSQWNDLLLKDMKGQLIPRLTFKIRPAMRSYQRWVILQKTSTIAVASTSLVWCSQNKNTRPKMFLSISINGTFLLFRKRQKTSSEPKTIPFWSHHRKKREASTLHLTNRLCLKTSNNSLATATLTFTVCTNTNSYYNLIHVMPHHQALLSLSESGVTIHQAWFGF